MLSKHPTYWKSISYNQRKEILSSIKYVKQVIPSKWLIANSFLKKNKIDVIIRGHDHKKDKFIVKRIIFPRTRGISSKKIRIKASKILKLKKYK